MHKTPAVLERWMPVGLTQWARLLALAAVYFASAKLGLWFASVQPNASPVWPATGIAVAAVLLSGYSVWPAIFGGAFLANALTAIPLPVAFLIAVGNTVEALSVGVLLRRFSRAEDILDHPTVFFQFAAIGAVSCVLSAVVGVTSITVAGVAPWSLYSYTFATWWLGDFIGLLIVTPLIMAWLQPPTAFQASRWLEACFFGAALWLTTQIVFGDSAPAASRYPLAFLYFPLYLWAVFRFGKHGATLTLLIVAAGGVWGTMRGMGTFALQTKNESLLLLQTYGCGGLDHAGDDRLDGGTQA